MEEEPSATCRYFCHRCSRIVRPEMGIEEVKCPHCHSGFVEEIAGAEDDGPDASEADPDVNAAPASLFAPTLIDLLGGGSSHRHGLDDGSGDLAAFARRQYRSIAFLQLLSALQEVEAGGDTPDSGRERLVLVSPADAHAMLTGGNGAAVGSGLTLGDLFVGPGLDALLEYLAETDPNRQGTPPAKKETVAALPTVRVRDAATCPVCLDQFAAGGEAREMPCKHRFHDGCIVPWLEAHSSCPVCRYQLPTDDSTDGNGITAEGGNGGGDGNEGSTGRRSWLAWPFGGLFSHRSTGSSSSS
ncbi:hypothetical protein ABZP36_018010 [Zizania latifolia]